MSHTPGPWRWLNDAALVGDHGHRPVVLAASPVRGGGNIAEFRQRDPSGRLVLLDTTSGDAMLIAAAPDLAKAAERAIAALDLTPETPGYERDRQAATDALIAALQKAGVR